MTPEERRALIEAGHESAVFWLAHYRRNAAGCGWSEELRAACEAAIPLWEEEVRRFEALLKPGPFRGT